ncbi:RNA-binding protein [Levilactobacillus namurensis]|uniref:RNA-binding protein n=1 Tax=Levilactobacillus namurensis TaxID=380393 RepID=A0AAW8W8V0_9LACO|nr:RNA-binding protein [Levilactobacillus namurensis]PTM23504.1 RNA-binding protein [Lactobacillus sp. PFC-70]MCW3778024.1 RNA-binding protein [Levilactobacillus namurensis]MDT7014771.1 RNA-binding protein [Levilactobacillus namurensis]MDT7018372.1 RNA-binding protein [Levilactobacillus namurensis]WNN64642.1 RNA-binding protein [Levilactobacillus namurensis]
MDENITQHFRPDEAPFIAAVGNWLQQVQDEYRPVLTHFLNPRQVYVATTLARRADIAVRFNGGYPGAEMQRALFYPAYYEPTITDFELSLVRVDYPVKFATLHHSQILGTLLGSGIEREIVGDILTDGQTWQLITETNMVNYLSNQIDRIGRVKARLVLADWESRVRPMDEWTPETATLSSLRLDNIVGSGFHLSRHRAKELIEAGKIRVNWADTEKPDYELAVADLVSVRGFGRIRLDEVAGRTKKEKIRVVLSVLKK